MIRGLVDVSCIRVLISVAFVSCSCLIVVCVGDVIAQRGTF